MVTLSTRFSRTVEFVKSHFLKLFNICECSEPWSPFASGAVWFKPGVSTRSSLGGETTFKLHSPLALEPKKAFATQLLMVPDYLVFSFAELDRTGISSTGVGRFFLPVTVAKLS